MTDDKEYFNDRCNENIKNEADEKGDFIFSTHQPSNSEQKIKKGRSGSGYLAIALICSLLGGIVGSGLTIAAQQIAFKNEKTVIGTLNEKDNIIFLEGIREKATIDTIPINTDKVLTAAQVYAANVNSTVGITTAITTNFWGYQSTSAASGSGFVISEDGYVLTNYHVIEASDSITVALFDGTSYNAKVIGCDESNDIAVLKIDAVGLSPVIFGDSTMMNVGDDVIAIGNPLGELTFSLTAGKVSAKDREVTFSNSLTMNLMQTDCAINSGNSGGALFNMYGEVVGVTNAKYTSSTSGASIDNIGFAIPINSIRTIVDSIIQQGYVTKPYVGVTVSDMAKGYQIYGLPHGASVQNIIPESPAEKAGLQVGDIITDVNGNPITRGNDFIKWVKTSDIGAELVLTVYRRGDNIQIRIKIGERIQGANEQKDQPNQYCVP